MLATTLVRLLLCLYLLLAPVQTEQAPGDGGGCAGERELCELAIDDGDDGATAAGLFLLQRKATLMRRRGVVASNAAMRRSGDAAPSAAHDSAGTALDSDTAGAASAATASDEAAWPPYYATERGRDTRREEEHLPPCYVTEWSDWSPCYRDGRDIYRSEVRSRQRRTLEDGPRRTLPCPYLSESTICQRWRDLSYWHNLRSGYTIADLIRPFWAWLHL
mmetsp:Transcript_73860/g.158377  ORF Transcript_73860/g.158377 Transcript_73860/m.158377 type:complete len:219 (-) Transcript_73860:45-701(-)